MGPKVFKSYSSPGGLAFNRNTFGVILGNILNLIKNDDERQQQKP